MTSQVTWVIKEASKKIRRPLLVPTSERCSKLTIDFVKWSNQSAIEMMQVLTEWVENIKWKAAFCFPRKQWILLQNWIYKLPYANARLCKIYVFSKMPQDNACLDSTVVVKVCVCVSVGTVYSFNMVIRKMDISARVHELPNFFLPAL